MIHRVIALLLVTLCLASCRDSLDPQEIRICRQTLPAVALDADGLTVTAVTPASPPFKIRIDYRTLHQGRSSNHSVFCAFGPSPPDNRFIELSALAADGRAFAAWKLHLLKRYWLERPEAALADPGPGETIADIPEVPSSIAFLVQSLGNGVPTTAMTMLIAVAYALVFGLVQRINLAFGDFATLGGVMSVSIMLIMLALGSRSPALDLVVVFAAAVGLVVLAGHIVEKLVFAPLAFRRGQTILIATVAVASVMREAMRVAQGPNDRWAPPVTSPYLPVVRSGDFVVHFTVMQMSIGAAAAIVAIAVVVLMHRSELGRRWRAISDDALMANLVGISSRGMLALTFGLASALAGFAGFIMTVYYGGADAYGGAMIGLKGLVAAVIGGIGSIEGALLGGLVLGLFEVVWQAYFPIEHRDVAVMTFLVLMLIFRPGGLFGFADATPRQV
ncbi:MULTISPECIES: branched-chain amino acid ABC transporter permease [Labrys]|uniref:Branched-chain amino acid ABC transporter permease n=1 Tax=Labrys neptuniae TaxID=376174 RepID=A0ABV3PH57_9HYPH